MEQQQKKLTVQKQNQQNNLSKTNEQEVNEGAQVEEIQEIRQKINDMSLKDKEKQNEENTSLKSQSSGEQVKSVENQVKQNQVYQTKYFVEINRTEITFGKNTLFPGSIEEVDVTIGLKDQILEESASQNPLMLRVIAKCSNAEFNELDEYVFSVRSNQRFQYFEQVRFRIRRKERAQVKVAVKIPPVKQNYIIEGLLEIQLQGLAPVSLPISAKCQVPKIICIKDLYKPQEDAQLIKIPAKKNQARMPPIPFKNLSNFNFTLEVQAIAHQSFSDRPYDVITQNFVNCQANNQFFVNMQLKENLNYVGQKPTRDVLRKILVLKIKNSSVFYHFPIEVQVFESSNQSTMS